MCQDFDTDPDLPQRVDIYPAKNLAGRSGIKMKMSTKGVKSIKSKIY